MRSRKELIYLNVKDLTEEEKEKLADYELNCCDKCGEIDLSTNLLWIDGEDFYDDEVGLLLLKKSFTAVCKSCYNQKAAEVNLINKVITLRRRWNDLKQNTAPIIPEKAETNHTTIFRGTFKVYGNRLEEMETIITELERILPEK